MTALDTCVLEIYMEQRYFEIEIVTLILNSLKPYTIGSKSRTVYYMKNCLRLAFYV